MKRNWIAIVLIYALILASLPHPAHAAVPVATSFSVTASTVGNKPITLQGSDPDGTPLTFAILSNPSHGAISNFSASTGVLIYTPTFGYTGADSFTFKVTSGGEDSNTATVSITVAADKTRIIDYVLDAGGVGQVGKVTFILTTNATSGGGLISPTSSVSAQTDATGKFDVTLIPSANLNPKTYYQLWFQTGYSDRRLLGVYDIPVSATPIALQTYRVTDTNLANRFTFADKASVDAVQTANANAVFQSLIPVGIDDGRVIGFDAGTGRMKSTALRETSTAVESTKAISAPSVSGNGANLTGLNANNLGAGTVPDARFPATLPGVSGANLTGLNASNLSSGTVANARIPSTIDGKTLTNTTLNSPSITGIIPDNVSVGGTLSASNLSGNCSSCTGITGATGGVANSATTTIGADTDANGSGVIALQTRGVDRLRVENDGSIYVEGVLSARKPSYLNLELFVCNASRLGLDVEKIQGYKGRLTCRNTRDGIYEWVDDRPVFDVTGFGADMADSGDDTAAALAAVNAARAAGGGRIYIPTGVLNVSPYFPVRQEVVSGLADYNNITIYGNGRGSVIKSASEHGGDVFQLNGVKNLRVQDVALTGVKTNPSSTLHGINGVSVTGGGQNIIFERVHVFDIPWEDKGTYLDGGKAFTIQPSTSPNPTENIQFLHCSSASSNGTSFTPTGFQLDLNGGSAKTNSPKDIKVEGCTFEAWYVGLGVSVSEASGADNNFPGMDIKLINNTIVGAQHGLSAVRASGMVVRGNHFNSTATSPPTAISWDIERIPITALGVYASAVEFNNIYYAAADRYLKIGGSVNSGDGNTYNSSFASNAFSGASSGGGIALENAGGAVVRRSKIVGNHFIGASGTLYPALLRYATYENAVETQDSNLSMKSLYVNITGGSPTGADVIFNGTLGFAYTDGFTAYNTLARNGLGIFAQQTASSSATAEVFGVLSNAGAKTWSVRNDGGMKLYSPYIFDGSDKVWLQRTVPASAVNYLELVASATGDPVGIVAKGIDANVSVNLVGKGSGGVQIGGGTAYTRIKRGSATLSAGAVTISDADVPTIGTNGYIMITQVGPSTGGITISAHTPGTSFTVTSADAGSNNTLYYTIYRY